VLKFLQYLFVALYATCASASATDLFFVVGQSGWQDQHVQAMPATVTHLNWSVGAPFTGIGAEVCRDNCPDYSAADGVVPAFANTWTSLSRTPARFVIYRKPDAALTQAGAGGKAYWTDFSAPNGIYQDALAELRKARQSATEATARRYLVWIQNETDARFGVTAKDYQTKLVALFNRFNKDLAGQGQAFDAMFIVSSGEVRIANARAPAEGEAAGADLDRMNAIVQAQDGAAAQGKIVMISRALRRSPEGCTGCSPRDLQQYRTWLFESLGAEMARNAYANNSEGIKPLQPASSKRAPSSCAATLDMYRWQALDNAAARPVYGTDPREVDEAHCRPVRMRLALFADQAPGRVGLYRNGAAGGPGVATEPDSPTAKLLGYCYAAPTGNAATRLVALQQDGMTALVRQSGAAGAAATADREGERTVCYVN
jgi:hypothetical protein